MAVLANACLALFAKLTSLAERSSRELIEIVHFRDLLNETVSLRVQSVNR
jgi:hypothetical protein